MSLPASVLLSIRPQMAMVFLAVAAAERRAGRLDDARQALRTSRIFDKPRLP